MEREKYAKCAECGKNEATTGCNLCKVIFCPRCIVTHNGSFTCRKCGNEICNEMKGRENEKVCFRCECLIKLSDVEDKFGKLLYSGETLQGPMIKFEHMDILVKPKL